MKFDKVISRFLEREDFDQDLIIAKQAKEKPPLPNEGQVIDNGQKKDCYQYGQKGQEKQRRGKNQEQ